MIHPVLYKRTKTGKTQVYKVSTEGDTVIVEQGQLDGAMQRYHTKCTPKNIGKSNETTPEQQAELEASSKYEKKIKSGYSTEISEEIHTTLPARVKVFQDQLKNIKFPCISTPKLNGVNGLFKKEKEEIIHYSRGGLVQHSIPHLEKEINFAMDYLKCKELNGEIYIHGQHLQDITSAVKKPKELSKQLQFHIFEIPDGDKEYQHRHQKLTQLLNKVEAELNKTSELPMVIPIIGRVCNSMEDIERHYNFCMDLGLEGTVIKNLTCEYKYNERSSDAFKYKKTLDGEYKILNYEVDKNSHPVFICEVGDSTFKVKPKGTSDERKRMIVDFSSLYKNKWYKIEYETLSKDGKPLKPVGICLRDCDSSGRPME